MCWTVTVLFLDAVEVCEKWYSWFLERQDCSQDLRIQAPRAAMIDHLCTFPLKQEINLSLRT